MNIMAILPLLLPMISSFMRGKSGDDLAGMVDNNQNSITNMLAGLNGSKGNVGGIQGIPMMGSDPNQTLATLMPLLMKQQPVFVVPNNLSAVTPTSQLTSDVRLEQIDQKLLEEIKDRLDSLEKDVYKE